MSNGLILPVKLTYHGGHADEGRLDLYDGSLSIHGFAKAIQISTHFLLHEEVIKKATASKGARFFIKSPRSGSFVEFIEIVIENHPLLSTVSAGVLTNAVYDILKTSLSRAVGISREPKSSFVQKLEKRIEPTFDDLSDALEGPLLDAHRTIEMDGGSVSIGRARSELLEFNKDTLDYIRVRDTQDNPVEITGNITLYNVLSGKGRLYDDEDEKTVRFQVCLQSIDPISKQKLTWSLNERNHSRPGKLRLHVRKIISMRGDIKKYLVDACSQIE